MNQPSSPSSALATISLIAGILSWLAIPFIGAVVAVICGHMARSEIRQSNGTMGGDGMAVTGLVLGYAQLIISALAALVIVIAIVFFGLTLASVAH